VPDGGKGDGIIPEQESNGPEPTGTGKVLESALSPGELLELVRQSLDDDKALEPVVIDLAGKTNLADFMVVATGTSQRHIASMAEKLMERLKGAGHDYVQAEGLDDPASTWILIDAGDILVHLFRAETRAFYDIEKLWSVAPPRRAAAAASS
jgi:ribosome-associated protein